MKKANSADRGSPTKGNVAPNDVDEYLAGVPEPARSTLNKVRASIRSAMPPGTTEVISYGIPTFKYGRPVMGYAAFANHCSLFPYGAAVIEAFKEELKDYPTSKGTIRFPIDKPPSAALVKKLVKAKLADNERKNKK